MPPLVFLALIISRCGFAVVRADERCAGGLEGDLDPFEVGREVNVGDTTGLIETQQHGGVGGEFADAETNNRPSESGQLTHGNR